MNRMPYFNLRSVYSTCRPGTPGLDGILLAPMFEKPSVPFDAATYTSPRKPGAWGVLLPHNADLHPPVELTVTYICM